MPNLNLKGDAPKSTASALPVSQPGGSAGVPKGLLVGILVVVVLGAGAFFLNKYGVVHLWGKRPVKPVAVNVVPVETPVTPDTAGLTSFKSTDRATLKTTVTAVGAPKAAGTSSALAGIPMSEGGRYSVQVSSWSSESKANVESDILKRAGFPSFVRKGVVPGEGSRYRVYIGKYESAQSARSNGDKMAHMLESGYWVVRLDK